MKHTRQHLANNQWVDALAQTFIQEGRADDFEQARQMAIGYMLNTIEPTIIKFSEY